MGYERRILYELLKSNQTVTAEHYQQFDLNALNQKRPITRRKRKVILHDNTRLHVVKVVRDTLSALRISPHVAYSSDCAPSDYHLFRSQHGLAN